MERFFQFEQWITGAQVAKQRAMEESSPADPTDHELLRQLAKGNETAFSALYARYQGPLYRFAWHMSGNSATAEEVTQEVFMLLIGSPKGYDATKGTFGGYLFGIARNLTRKIMQRSRLDLPIEEEWLDADDSAFASDLDVLADLSNSELLDYLRKAVLALPEQYREVVALCELEEMSYADAATLLDCAPGTVASRLHRARTLLKEKLKAKLSSQKCLK
ncbi:MAG TPA: RNA polymerase sigma factor [Candidatus Angelobacter sp.]